MGVVLQNTFAVILSVEFTIGNLGNGFIILVNCLDWVERRKISSVNQILTALAISRIAVFWVIFLGWWVSVFYPALYMAGGMLRMTYIAWTVSNHFHLWFSASLSIFYFLKIANFSNTIFLYLKFRVKKVVSLTLLISLFLLCFNIVVIKAYIDMSVDGAPRNVSYSMDLCNSAQFTKLFSFTNPMFTSLPFTVSLATFLLLIFSLWKHLRRMHCNAQGNRDASTTAHVRALQTVVASILLYIVFILLLFVKVWSSEFPNTHLVSFFVQALGIAVPSAHSFVLILGNSRLRGASLSVLQWLRCRLKNDNIHRPFEGSTCI